MFATYEHSVISYSAFCSLFFIYLLFFIHVTISNETCRESQESVFVIKKSENMDCKIVWETFLRVKPAVFNLQIPPCKLKVTYCRKSDHFRLCLIVKQDSVFSVKMSGHSIHREMHAACI